MEILDGYLSSGNAMLLLADCCAAALESADSDDGAPKIDDFGCQFLAAAAPFLARRHYLFGQQYKQRVRSPS